MQDFGQRFAADAQMLRRIDDADIKRFKNFLPLYFAGMRWIELRNINDNDEQYVTPQHFDVLEYWEPVDGHQLMEYGVTDIDEQAEYQANIWICDGRMIMVRLNPLKPETIPYKFVPYKSVLHRFLGIGIPYMMNDSQDVMNSTGRVLLDNAALTAGPMF